MAGLILTIYTRPCMEYSSTVAPFLRLKIRTCTSLPASGAANSSPRLFCLPDGCTVSLASGVFCTSVGGGNAEDRSAATTEKTGTHVKNTRRKNRNRIMFVSIDGTSNLTQCLAQKCRIDLTWTTHKLPRPRLFLCPQRILCQSSVGTTTALLPKHPLQTKAQRDHPGNL